MASSNKRSFAKGVVRFILDTNMKHLTVTSSRAHLLFIIINDASSFLPQCNSLVLADALQKYCVLQKTGRVMLQKVLP